MTTETTWYWDGGQVCTPDGVVVDFEDETVGRQVVANHNAALVSPAGVDLALVRSILESKIKDDRYHPQYILGMAFALELLESVAAAPTEVAKS